MQNPSRADYYTNLPLPDGPPVATEPPTPDNPPWGVLAATGLWFLSILFILFVPLFFLLPYLATRAEPVTDAVEIAEMAKTDPAAIFLQIAAILPAHILTVLVAWLIVTRGRKYSFRELLGWQSGGFRWWHYVAVLAAFMVVAAAVSSVWPEQENDLIRMLRSSRSAVYITALIATFTAPLVEEVIYRGIVYSAFRKRFGVAAGFITATALFALVHVPQYYPSFSTIFLLTLLSVTLTAIRVRTGNLLPCIILHTLFNGLQSLTLIFEPMVRPETGTPDAAGLIFHLFR
jgi:membrane protease YdiL (CAAX protease family)